MRPVRKGRLFLPLLLLAAVMLAACLSGCGTEVKAKGQMIGGVSRGPSPKQQGRDHAYSGTGWSCGAP